MKVTYFQRRPRPNSNYSLEFIFENVRSCLKDRIQASVCIAPAFSSGIFRRIWIGLDAMWHQGEVNHVTGDINFAAIFLRYSRTIITIHDCGFAYNASGIRRQILQLFWLTLPVRRAKVITTVSENAKSEIVRLSRCDPNKVVIIPVAISDRYKPSLKCEIAAVPRLLQVGTAINKNLSRLIEAIDGISCVLAIVGRLNQEMLEKLAMYGIQYENFVNLNEHAIVEQYQLADVVVFASTYEGFGMPILEAQAIGRPVVTSNVSSMPEVAGDAARLVDPFDVHSIRSGIEEVIHSPEYRNVLIERGFNNVKRFDADVIANLYLDLYVEIYQTAKLRSEGSR